jgi:hypothetical protein
VEIEIREGTTGRMGVVNAHCCGQEVISTVRLYHGTTLAHATCTPAAGQLPAGIILAVARCLEQTNFRTNTQVRV